MLRTEFRDFPAGQVAVNTVKECRVGAHLRRERLKQRGGFQHNVHALVDIAHKYHGGRGRLLLFAARKGAGRHVVLHDLHAVFVLELNAGNLVKGNAVPQTDQAHGLAPHVIEQVGHGGLATGNQDTVGRNFLIDMGFTGAARAKLTQVEVILYQRNHTGQQQPLFTIGKRFRLITGRTQHQAQPFFLAECLASLPDLIQIDMGHLDRCHAVDADRRRLFIFLDKFIAQLHNAPDAAAEQAVKLFRVFVSNRHIANSKIGKLCKKAVLFHIQSDSHHINNCVAAFLTQLRKNLLRFIRAYKVIGKNTFHILYAFFNNIFII